jgi:hypothetical protein
MTPTAPIAGTDQPITDLAAFVIGWIDLEIEATRDPVTEKSLARLRDRLTPYTAAGDAADTPPPLEVNGVAYTPATWRDAYELVAAAMRAVAAEGPQT